MNRTIYFNYIDEKLTTLCTRINNCGRLNLLELHTHSENFYQHFCRELYGWELENLNKSILNVEAIDLVDDGRKLIVQVSATNTKQKLESSLKKNILKAYSAYNFKFISIAKDADSLRTKTFDNPHLVIFNPVNDIYDSKSILNDILGLDIESLKRIYKFIKLELGSEIDIVKLDTNLAAIINLLAKEDWSAQEAPTINSFEIERKITYNNLQAAREIINDYSAHYNRLNKIYSEFDSLGVNKSNSVLNKIRTIYLKKINAKTEDELFFNVIDEILKFVLNSTNFVSIPIDELELCVNVIVVDAFIRCKIFKNPGQYNYVNS